MKRQALGEIAEVYQSPSIGRFKGEPFDEQPIYMLKAGDLKHFKLEVGDLTDEDRVDVSPKKIKDELWLSNQDVLTSIRGTILNTSYIDNQDNVRVLPSSNLALIRIKKDVDMIPTYLIALFRSKYGKSLVEPFIRSTSIPMLSTSNLKKLEIPIPSREVQENISAMFQALDEHEQAQQKIHKFQLELAEAGLSNIFEGAENDEY